MAELRPHVVCINASGALLARRIADSLGVPLDGRADRVAEADHSFANALDHVRALFAAGHPVIGVCAAGILIRAVAPLLNDKRTEPPVIAVSEDGLVVPLLGGHHGANRLARQIAQALDGIAAVTTAGDVALGIALDEPPLGWRLSNPEAAKPAMVALLAGGGATIDGDAPWLDGLRKGGEVAIAAHAGPVQDTQLAFRPLRYTLGVGCARNCPPDELAVLVEEALGAAGIVADALAGVFTLDLKADEPAVLELAVRHGLDLRIFDASRLEAEAGRLATPSEVVFAEVGCHGVAEGAALAAAGPDAVLTVTKRKSANATVAIAETPAVITALPGRRRGKVSLVGIGPGQSSWRTPEASRLIAEADELVGYGLYIDLIGAPAMGKPRQDFPLGGEEDRCRYALERAGEGHNVAIICSGDAGIYAMGALVFELLDRAPDTGGVSDPARRVEVVSAPGVSALQAAAARSGAPLGHDFCAISLSDLLTPTDDIRRRVKSAAEGDFVIAFYNPVSKRRRTLLAEAKAILLAHRPDDTPVLLARSLGRPDETLRYVPLSALGVDDVDMMTVVLVGSSHSRLAQLGEGPRMYTPRGYARKMQPTASEKLS